MSEPVTPPPAPTPARTFWQRRVRDPIVAQLTQGITPEKIALTIAVGSAFALFPVLGTTTLLCLLVGLALRLNQPVIQLLNQALWPLHIPTIYLCVRLGERIFHAPTTRFHIREMHTLFWHEPARFFHDYGIVALHAIVAWAILTPPFIALVYYGMLPVTRAIARVKTEAEAKRAAPPSDHPVP